MSNDKLRVTNHRYSSVPIATTAEILSLQTSATGSTFVAFGSSYCDCLDIVNISGATIEYQRGGTGTAFPIPTSTSRLITGISNANEISIRRTDLSGTQVTIAAEALTL